MIEVPASQQVEALARAGQRGIHLTVVDSTMSEASRQAESGSSGPLWIIADQQSQGRGRHGRNWVSPPGNLHATLLLTTGIVPERAAEIGFVAGLALHDAAATLTGLAPPRLQLKWPNDLLLDRAKCAGLLLEGTSQGDRFTLAIGFGVNLIDAPHDTPYKATSLGQCAPGLDAVQFMPVLAKAMMVRLAEWEAGFGAIRLAWRQRAAFMGETVTLRLPAGPVTGQFIDVDMMGRLELLTDEGRRIIDAGDLFFGAASA